MFQGSFFHGSFFNFVTGRLSIYFYFHGRQVINSFHTQGAHVTRFDGDFLRHNVIYAIFRRFHVVFMPFTLVFGGHSLLYGGTFILFLRHSTYFFRISHGRPRFFGRRQRGFFLRGYALNGIFHTGLVHLERTFSPTFQVEVSIYRVGGPRSRFHWTIVTTVI